MWFKNVSKLSIDLVQNLSKRRDQDVTPTNNLTELRTEVETLEAKKHGLVEQMEQDKADMTAELESISEKIDHLKENQGPTVGELNDLRQKVVRLHDKARVFMLRISITLQTAKN